MLPKSKIVRVSLYVIACVIVLSAIALVVPGEIFSLPIYITCGVISTLAGVRLLLSEAQSKKPTPEDVGDESK